MSQFKYSSGKYVTANIVIVSFEFQNEKGFPLALYHEKGFPLALYLEKGFPLALHHEKGFPLALYHEEAFPLYVTGTEMGH